MKNIIFCLLLIIIGAICCKDNPVITPTPPAKPTVILTVNPTNVAPKIPVTITWSSSNAHTCVGIGFDTNYETSGTVVVNPIRTTTFLLVGIGRGGISDTAKAKVSVEEIIGLGNYYRGGIIFYIDLSGEHGLIAKASPRLDWDSAMKSGDLPSIEQLKMIYEKRAILKDILAPPNYWDQSYWSKSLPPEPDAQNWAQIIDFGIGPLGHLHVGYKKDVHNVVYLGLF